MDNNDLNPLQRFIAKRELEHKAVAPLERPPPVSAPVLVRAQYPGIGRLAYAAATWHGGPLFRARLSRRPLRGAPRDVDVCGHFHGRRQSYALTAARLQNLGKSLWWLGVWLIPFVGFYITILCLAAPTGYAQHRQWTLSAERSLHWQPSSPSLAVFG